MNTRVRDIPEQLGRGMAVLVGVVALAWIVRGLGYFGPLAIDSVPAGLIAIAGIMPLWIWGVAHILASLSIVVGIVFRPAWIAGTSLMAGICAVWFVGYTSAWITGENVRGWVTAAGVVADLALALLLARIGPPVLHRRTDA